MGLLEIICALYPLPCIKNYLSISKSLSCTSSYTLGIYLVKIISNIFFIFEDFPPLPPNIKTTPRHRERRSIKMVLGDLGPNLELWGLNRRFAATGWRCRPRGLNRRDPDRLEPSVYRHIDMNMRLSPISDRLEICQNIYTTQFSSPKTLHTENA